MTSDNHKVYSNMPRNIMHDKKASGNDTAEILYDLLMRQSGLHINTAVYLFSRLTAETFESVVNKFHETGDFDSKQTLIYYLILFRKEPGIRNLLEDASMPLEFIESIILTIAARSNLSVSDNDQRLDELLDTLPMPVKYDLLTKTRFISRDQMIVHYILAKLDKKHLDLYFHDTEKSKRFVIGICTIPEELMRALFLKNPELHGFFIMLLDTVDEELLPKARELCNISLTEIEKTKKIALEISMKFNLSSELVKPLAERDIERYSLITNRIQHLDDLSAALANLVKERVIDMEEQSLLHEIILNPLFSDILYKYSKSHSNEETHNGTFFF